MGTQPTATTKNATMVEPIAVLIQEETNPLKLIRASIFY